MDKKNETSSRQNNQHETITCPKCGNLNDASSKECLKCGIVFSKYREFKERKGKTQEQLVETGKLRKERKENKKNRLLFIPSFLKKKLIIKRSMLAWFGAGVVFVALGFIIFLILRGPENTNRPNYLKNLTVYKEGQDGLVIYFILADNFGQPTAYDGLVLLRITREDDPLQHVYIRKRVKCSDFSSTTIGLGPYKRKTILYPFGRIPYSFLLNLKSYNFSRPLKGSKGKVKLWYVYGKLPYNLEQEPLVGDFHDFVKDILKVLTPTADYFHVEEEFTF